MIWRISRLEKLSQWTKRGPHMWLFFISLLLESMPLEVSSKVRDVSSLVNATTSTVTSGSRWPISTFKGPSQPLSCIKTNCMSLEEWPWTPRFMSILHKSTIKAKINGSYLHFRASTTQHWQAQWVLLHYRHSRTSKPFGWWAAATIKTTQLWSRT